MLKYIICSFFLVESLQWTSIISLLLVLNFRKLFDPVNIMMLSKILCYKHIHKAVEYKIIECFWSSLSQYFSLNSFIGIISKFVVTETIIKILLNNRKFSHHYILSNAIESVKTFFCITIRIFNFQELVKAVFSELCISKPKNSIIQDDQFEIKSYSENRNNISKSCQEKDLNIKNINILIRIPKKLFFFSLIIAMLAKNPKKQTEIIITPSKPPIGSLTFDKFKQKFSNTDEMNAFKDFIDYLKYEGIIATFYFDPDKEIDPEMIKILVNKKQNIGTYINLKNGNSITEKNRILSTIKL
ncbi:hypothetical protein EDEG_02670 [Edhazardia aedis USNM 41457]|uniref:Uncharacterized protein n=1 Tax=Edhazardia aedis (strain USNM 41457) TaxID=1003232 RepID=J9D557_EDHAE|nr:hypothetical protein EDEG_02670 [Edhazardia aedis USNM 41457]|eukprot:EJW02941.1 hypothetical protein EDEG_02670 [Edhazardia aedis USNM 41457]